MLFLLGVYFYVASLNQYKLLSTCHAGLGHLIAKNEDEYVQLALQLASDIPELSNLRMSLRDLMSKSPVCDGPNFILDLESTYRKMWHRYCKDDVPSLKRIEQLREQGFSEAAPIKNSEPTSIPLSLEGPPESVKENGFNAVPSSTANHSSEENGSQSVESDFR